METVKLNAKQLRKSDPHTQDVLGVKKNPIYFILDNVLDTYNIGSLFRLADAVGVQKIYLCGNMEYPPSSRIHKAAVGTENWVAWEKVEKGSDIVTKLQRDGVQVVAVEQSPMSIDYRKLTADIIQSPVAIVVGHETHGVNKDVLNAADIIVELPMFGINKSFNVWGSAAVIAYKVIEVLSKPSQS